MIYGVAQPRENVASMAYTRQAIARGNHVVEQNLSLAEAVAGRILETPEVEFPYDEAAEQACDRQLREEGIADFVLMNPGAGWGAKRWPAERYGDLARQLAADGLKSPINVGPGEQDLLERAIGASGGAAKGRVCSLAQLIAFTGRARLFIGGDTGPLHLAAARGIPVVAIFGPTNPARNGPFGGPGIVLRSPASTTSHARRAQPDKGILEISSDQVVRAARQLLRGKAMASWSRIARIIRVPLGFAFALLVYLAGKTHAHVHRARGRGRVSRLAGSSLGFGTRREKRTTGYLRPLRAHPQSALSGLADPRSRICAGSSQLVDCRHHRLFFRRNLCSGNS